MAGLDLAEDLRKRLHTRFSPLKRLVGAWRFARPPAQGKTISLARLVLFCVPVLGFESPEEADVYNRSGSDVTL